MEKEVDLVDYIRVIFKGKWIIILVTFLTMLTIGILSWLKPAVYESSAVLELGKIGELSLDTPIQLQEKINQGSYNVALKEKSGIDSIPKIEVSVTKDTSLLMMKIKSRNQDEGKKILESLSDIIISEHNKIFEGQKKFIENEIKREEQKIAILERSSNFSELQFLYLEHLSRIDKFENDLALASPTRLVKSPLESVSSRNIITNLIISGVLGLLVGVSLSFFQEFLSVNKDRLKSN